MGFEMRPLAVDLFDNLTSNGTEVLRLLTNGVSFEKPQKWSAVNAMTSSNLVQYGNFSECGINSKFIILA